MDTKNNIIKENNKGIKNFSCKKIINGAKKIIVFLINTSISVLTPLAMVISAYIGVNAVENVANLIIEQKQEQTQEQTQIVVEPREGDIIVTDGDDFKLLQLINKEDVSFPTKVQEIRHSYDKDIEKRVYINESEKESLIKCDSFEYMINNFSINPNKVINLLVNIESITVCCDFYKRKNISDLVVLKEEDLFRYNMIDENNKNDFSVSNINIASNKYYVTGEVNDGFEWVKIKVDIVYFINEIRITDIICSDWIETDADFFA